MKKASIFIIFALIAAVLMMGCDKPAVSEDTTPTLTEDSTPAEEIGDTTPSETTPETPNVTGDDIGVVPPEWN